MTVPLFDLSNVIPVAQDAIDTIILALGRPCRLIYPPLTKQCPNCNWDTAAKRSSGVYAEGGPMPFNRGQNCPICNTKGVIETEQTDTITLLCNFTPKDWNAMGLPAELQVRVPGAAALTKGFLTDLPKIKRCREAVLATNIEAYTRLRFQLAGDPLDVSNIVQGRYFIALWKRAG